MLYRVFSGTPSPILQIESLGYAKDPSNTRCGPIARPLYLIHYCIKGKGYFNGNPVLAGEGFVIYPNQPALYYPDERQPWEYVWIASRDSRIAPFLHEYTGGRADGIFTFGTLRAAGALSQYVVHNCDRILDGSLVLERFLSLFNDHRCTTRHLSLCGADYCDIACHYIELNYHTHLMVEDITSFLGISQPYLYRLFMRYRGLSPKAYLNACRMDSARHLLRSTELSVTEIALAVGYTELQAFLRFFKEQSGQTPTQYRRASHPHTQAPNVP